MFDYIPDGQFSFSDYCNKPKIDIKPKSLVDFINSMGMAQYTQIGNIVRDTVKTRKYDIPEEIVERITNNVSVWLLIVGDEYKKYLHELIEDGEKQ